MQRRISSGRTKQATIPVAVSEVRYRLSLFGPLRLESGRETVTRFRTAPTAALLAYLALHPGVSHTREKLIALLWPDAPLSAGRNNLSVSLHYLRGLLTSLSESQNATQEVLCAERNVITLTPGIIATDADQFEALLSKARQSRDSQEQSDLAEAALRLCQGTFLEGMYSEWVLEEQRRFDVLYDEASALRPSPVLRRPPTPKTAIDVAALPAETFGSISASWVMRHPSLPHRLSRFFARDMEIAALCAALQGHRLVTLTGPGGVGKTRLSEQAARQAADENGRRVRFVPLDAWNDARRLDDALAAAMRLTPSGGNPFEALVHALAAEPTLLLLDNLEHLLPDAGEFVERLLTRVPDLICLATSRRPLKAEGERVFPVAPLPTPLPTPTEDANTVALAENPAVALFVDRARAARPDFRLTERNRESVAALCRDLDGMPLSLELAAARSLTLTPERMRAELAQNSQRLLSRNRGGAARHRSLHAAIEWSYRLLTPEAQRFFAALSVFTGGWTAEAAEAITENPLAGDLLAELTDDSLVRTHFADDGRTVRFSMLETLRAFAANHLPKRERDALTQCHADYYLTEAETFYAQLYYGEHRNAVRYFRQEDSNLMAALETLRPDPEKLLRMATVTRWRWAMLAPARGAEMFAPALVPIPGVADNVRAHALCALSHCAVALGKEGQTMRAEARRIFREMGDTVWFLRCTPGLSDPDSLAEYSFAENLAAAEGAGDLTSAALFLNFRGVGLWPTGQTEEADRCFADALRRFRAANALFFLSGGLFEWGYSLLWRGEPRRARPLLLEAIRIAGEFEEEDSHPSWMLAGVEIALGAYADAEGHARRAVIWRRQPGPTPLLFQPLRHLFLAQLHQGNLNDARETLRELEAVVAETKQEFPLVQTGPPSIEIAWAEGYDAEALAIAQETVEATDAAHKHPDLSSCGFWAGITVANARAMLAHAELRLGLPDIARETLQETLRFRDRCNIRGRALADIEGIAAALTAENEPERAARLFAAAHVLRLRAGTPLPPSHAAYFSPLADAAKLAHPAPWRTGTRLTLEAALAEALTLS